MPYYYGTVGDDVINGSDWDDYIYGGPNGYYWDGPGRDTLYGNGGNDYLYGGESADKLYGGAGNDYLNGYTGNDEYYFSGSFGQDTIEDYYGSNKVVFTDLDISDVSFEYDGDDLFIMKNGSSDRVAIRDYHDYSGYYTIQFADGIWTNGPTNGNDTLIGTWGDDRIDALAGNDSVSGGWGNDTLTGNTGNDRLYGEGGDDWLIGGPGNDVLDGGVGSDWANYWRDGGTGGVTVDLALGRATRGGETDTLYSIENVGGTDYNDTIKGNSLANYLTGGNGNDSIYGVDGNDLLAGGNGNDLLDGGTGSDTVTYEVSGAAVKIDLGLAKGMRGSEVDRFVGIENAKGSSFADEIRGSSGANELNGLGGNDTLYGGAGNDVLYGGTGNDRIIGQTGYDRMYGEAGKDVFDINPGDTGIGPGHRDIIVDFQRGSDKIDLASFDANASRAGDQAFTFIGTNGFTAAGQLHYLYDGSNTIVQASTDADSQPELEIQLTGRIALTAADFVL
ncbi:calcium-binding protein [Benzoatithermus flavus]|uniref:Calcium-binding protein n=1 Tax=Benzoatithermus flavus TaxID=3108223 RepID=A0ABU8XQ80_9PROT